MAVADRSFTSPPPRTAVVVHEFCAPVPFQPLFGVTDNVSRKAVAVVTAPVLYCNCTFVSVVPADGCTSALTFTLSKLPGEAGLIATELIVGAACRLAKKAVPANKTI